MAQSTSSVGPIKAYLIGLVQQREDALNKELDQLGPYLESSIRPLMLDLMKKIADMFKMAASAAMPQFYSQYSPWKYVRTDQLMALVPNITYDENGVYAEYASIGVGYHPNISSSGLVQMTAAGYRAAGRGRTMGWTFSYAPLFYPGGTMEEFFSQDYIDSIIDKFINEDPDFFSGLLDQVKRVLQGYMQLEESTRQMILGEIEKIIQTMRSQGGGTK